MGTKLQERLKGKGFEDQEIAIFEKLFYGTEVSNLEYLATKEDVAKLDGKIDKVEGSLKQEIAKLDGKIDKVEGSLKQEIASVKSELKEDIANVKGELKEEISGLSNTLLDKMNSNLKWTVAAILIPLTSIFITILIKF